MAKKRVSLPLFQPLVSPHAFEKGNYKRTTHPKKEKQTAISPICIQSACALKREEVTRVPIFLSTPSQILQKRYIVLTSEKEDKSGQDSTDIHQRHVSGVTHTHENL